MAARHCRHRLTSLPYQRQKPAAPSLTRSLRMMISPPSPQAGMKPGFRAWWCRSTPDSLEMVFAVVSGVLIFRFLMMPLASVTYDARGLVKPDLACCDPPCSRGNGTVCFANLIRAADAVRSATRALEARSCWRRVAPRCGYHRRRSAACSMGMRRSIGSRRPAIKRLSRISTGHGCFGRNYLYAENGL
jgi:hypothetical protein